MEESRKSAICSIKEKMRLFDFCERNANFNGNSVCFIHRAADLAVQTWTWSELFQEVLSVAGLLKKCKIEPGSRVLNLTANSLEWILVELACSCINAVHVPIDTRLSFAQVLPIMRNIEPVLILVDDEEFSLSFSTAARCLSSFEIRDFVDRARFAASPSDYQSDSIFQDNDVANILFTSGTSSSPKGVMLSHRNLVQNALAKLDAMPQFPSDHRLNLLPFSHAYAKTCELATWLISRSSLEIATSNELFARLAVAKPTLFNGVPLLFKRIHSEWEKRGGGREALDTLTGGRMRQFASGGAPIHDDLRASFEQSGFPIYQGYGLTEAGPVVCSNRSGANSGGLDRCLVGVGPKVKGVELKIDSERKLWVRGDGVMLGYWNDPLSTAKRIQDGWLDTGDVASIDEVERVKILGRSDDTIVLENGYKIDPLGIEQLLCNIEGVKDCALVSDDQSGYDVVLLCEEEKVAKENREQSWKMEIEREILGLLSKQSVVHPHRVIFTIEDWSETNGLRNYKGAKNRGNIKQWVSENHYTF